MIRFENCADSNTTTVSFQVSNKLLPQLSKLIEKIEGAKVLPGRQAQEAPQTQPNLVCLSWILHRLINYPVPTGIVWNERKDGEDLTGFHGNKCVDVVLDHKGTWSAYYDNTRIAFSVPNRDLAEDVLVGYADAQK